MTVKPNQRLMVCNCQRTMTIDADKLAVTLGLDKAPVIHTELCRAQIGAYEAALQSGDAIQVACTQEAPLFREVATEKGSANADLTFTNIRERAGWCTAQASATPKMAALLAEATYSAEPAGTTTLTTQGICLVYGRGQMVLDTAAELADRLSVSVLLSDAGDATPPNTTLGTIAKGRIRKASGRLGAYEIDVDGYAAALPSSRAAFEFALARNGARSTCDIILDLSGGPALFSDGQRRDGYLRADPNNPAAIARAMFKATDLLGEFEKPLYVSYDKGICAHSRSAKTGCTKCLDVCPTGAIVSAGDHVAIDHKICAGCGTCSAVCPTGAVTYTYPKPVDLIGRMHVLLNTYAKAGGKRPILLLHDESHGSPLISAIARQGRGLPVNVLPLALFSVTEVGHDLLAAALVLGAEQVVILGSPQHIAEQAALDEQIALLRALLAGLGYDGDRIHLTTTPDPDAVSAVLDGLVPVTAITPEAFVAKGTKRTIARTVLSKLHAAAPKPVDRVTLPKGAPYGRIAVKTDGCTLCLACVGACPANALADHPERPELSFTEAACVQCGICVATCPEKVITLEPGYNFRDSALRPEILRAEEPFRCVSCNKPFGTKSTINKVIEKLKGRHAMFQNEAQVRLIQMCDTCRVVTLSEQGNDPMRVGERPKIRRTEDYLAEAEAEKAKAAKPKKPDDFLS
jgi:ferredoxin